MTQQITQIGHGNLEGEHVVFCVVDFDKLVLSSSYPEEREYGMYYFEAWVQKELDRGKEVIDYLNISVLDRFNGYSAITRKEPKISSKSSKTYEDSLFGKTPKQPYIRDKVKVGRNEKCSCGSNNKYKKCCG